MNDLFDQGETKETHSLVQKEGLDWHSKAEWPFPVSSYDFEISLISNLTKKFCQIELWFLGLS